jgi:methylthioribose-1-phosphate isomerase
MRWEGGPDGRLLIIEQTLLPAEEREVVLGSVVDVADAIYRLAVRGAPAIGITAAYGLVISAQAVPDQATPAETAAALEADRVFLAKTRPTAVNLTWALDRMAGLFEPAAGPVEMRQRLLDEARRIHDEDRQACLAMARFAAPFVREGGSYLTHCNAGSLATGGIGTALGVFHLAAREGKNITVYADETRPLLQGARLTSWELHRSGIAVKLICDSAAATFLTRGPVEAVFVGADRVAGNGDAANKLGTLSVALAARHAGIPFYVVAPVSTFDLSLADGSEIPIEERAPEEVTDGFGPRTAPQGIGVSNPAFDVTPAHLITALITERGVIEAPTAERIRSLLS